MRRLLLPLSLAPLFALLLAAGPEKEEGKASRPTGASKPSAAAPAEGPARALPVEATFGEYAVASAHPDASEAGAKVLSQGGTAADAAAAVMLTLGVVSPSSSGLGGGGFALYYKASDRSLTFLDFREQAPGASTPEMFAELEKRSGKPLDEPLADPSQLGGLAVAAPGEAAGIETLLQRFGRLPRAKVVEPARHLAQRGFAISAWLEMLSTPFAKQLKRDPVYAAWFKKGSDTLVQGQRVRNLPLAKTLGVFAKQGAKPFYEGAIAKDIVRGVRAKGGILSLEDLKRYRVAERKPLEAERFGYRWVTAPPPSAGGYTMLASLQLLERWLPANKRKSELEVYHALTEAFKGPFADRVRYFGDPDQVQVPVAELMDSKRVERRMALFQPTKARNMSDYALPLPARGPERALRQPQGGGTSHFCVVDKEGNVASVTTTVNLAYGARFTVDGMAMNNEMDDFARPAGQKNAFGLEEGANNLPAPYKRPVSTMTPSIVFRDDKPVLCIGGAGGSRIVTAVTQVAFRTLVLGQSLQQASRWTRIHHQGVPATLFGEGKFPLRPELIAGLKKRGHQVESEDTGKLQGGVSAIHIERNEGKRLLHGSGDVRRGGSVAGR